MGQIVRFEYYSRISGWGDFVFSKGNWESNSLSRAQLGCSVSGLRGEIQLQTDSLKEGSDMFFKFNADANIKHYSQHLAFH